MSTADYATAIAEFQEAIRMRPGHIETLCSLAWLLTNCPELQLRNAAKAHESAKRAVKLYSESPQSWQALGWAEYRAGNWNASIDSLNKSIELQEDGGDPGHWYFLAMACWHLGEQGKARQWYEKSVERTKTNSDFHKLQHIRAEAESLLGIESVRSEQP